LRPGRCGLAGRRWTEPGVIFGPVGPGDVADPSGGREDGALVVTAGRRVSSGDVMSLAVPVVTVPVKVSRSGAVRADGWLPDQVRPGLLETVLGDGVIEELKRLMSLPFAMRIVIAPAGFS